MGSSRILSPIVNHALQRSGLTDSQLVIIALEKREKPAMLSPEDGLAGAVCQAIGIVLAEGTGEMSVFGLRNKELAEYASLCVAAGSIFGAVRAQENPRPEEFLEKFIELLEEARATRESK